MRYFLHFQDHGAEASQLHVDVPFLLAKVSRTFIRFLKESKLLEEGIFLR